MKRAIFLHGVGSSGSGMAPLAEAIGLAVPVHCPDGPETFNHGQGRQWFSIDGVTEANRPARVASALPGFRKIVSQFGDPGESLLIGFSQGSIMALAAVADGLPAAGVIAIAGRLAGPVARRADWPPITLLHGGADPMMPPAVARATEAWLKEAGASPRLTLFEGLGHAVDARVVEAIRAAIAAGSSSPS